MALGPSFTIATLAQVAHLEVSSPRGLLAASGGIVMGLSLRSRLARPWFQRALLLVFIVPGGANLSRVL